MSSSLAQTGSTSSLLPAPSQSTPSSSSLKTSSSTSNSPNYLSELSSIIYVFTQTHAPPPLLNTIQDLLRSHLHHLLLLAKSHSLSHSLPITTTTTNNKNIVSTGAGGGAGIGVEEMLFVIRKEKGMVERLRGYLGWKDVRKRTKEPGSIGGGANGNVEEEEGMVDGIEEPDKNLKVGKGTIHLSWELQDPYQEYLDSSSTTTSLGSSYSSTPIGESERQGGRDAEYEKALEENRQILREADELTSKMSKEEYDTYSQARQASFVYRKGKKFRDFLLLDIASSLSEEVLDILGFLAYEFIRRLCRLGLSESSLRKQKEEEQSSLSVIESKKRKLSTLEEEEGGKKKSIIEELELEGLDPRSPNYPSVLLRPPPSPRGSKEIVNLFSKPLEEKDEEVLPFDDGGDEEGALMASKKRKKDKGTEGIKGVASGIELKDVLDGFWKDSNCGVKEGMGKGLRGFRGGAGAMKGLRRSF